MSSLRKLDEAALAALAKKVRLATGKSCAQVARELGVSRPAIHYAEEDPTKSLALLRKRIIEKYSAHRIEGPIYLVKYCASPSPPTASPSAPPVR